MAESNKNKEISNERAELIKGFNKNNFANTSNQIFARTQSTPLEDQKKATLSSFKNKLKASQALKSQNTPAFIPGSNAANEFLSATPNQPSSATSQTATETQPSVKTTGPSTFVPAATTTTTTPITTTEKPAATTTTSLNIQKTDSTGSATTASTTGAGAAAKGGSLKSKLKLSSSSFSAPFNPEGASATTTAKPTITPFIPGGGDQAALGDWSKPSAPIAKTAEEKKAGSNASPSKINLKSASTNYEFRPGQAKTNLDIIPETKAENKQEAAPTKVEPVVENKKPEQVPAQPSDEFTEVTKKKPTRKYDNLGPKAEAKKEVPAPAKKEEVKPVETKKEEPSPKKEVKPEVKEAEKKHEEKSFATPAKSEVKIEIIMMTRAQFAEAVQKMTEVIKDRKVPEHLEKYRNREILSESLKKRAGGGGQDIKSNKPENKQFDRGTQQQPTPAAMEGFERGTSMRKEVEEPPKEKTFVRLGLTPEEKAMKEKLNSSVNAWMAGKKGEKDPEEVIKKDIKFNLNIITLDNFDKIKDIILDIASQKFDNCRRVAEFIVENAWTQKQYVNIYAKLCDFLGRQDRLNFDEAKGDGKKKKNDFKLQIMKQIQTVFENETIVGIAKKPVEEMNAEEKTIYYMKRKQRILGNVSFIGELFLEKFLVIGIVRLITTSLLKKYLAEYDAWSKSPEKSNQRLFEDTLEGLIKFYEIIGQAVEDKESSTKTKEKEKEKKPSHAVANFEKILKQVNANTPTENLSKFGEDDEVSLNDLFKIFNVMLEDGNLTTRLSSLIQNLVYRRDNKWAASLAKNSGPKTLKELHEEFEKEKIEEERRADEYREELRDNYYPQPQRGGKGGRTEVSFQVVSDTKSSRQQEESKVDLSSLQVDQNIVFKPQRGKQQGGQASQPAKPKVNYEQIEREFKDVYKLLSGETVEDKTNPEEELKKMAAKHGGRNVLQVYFKTFYDGRTEAVKKRLFIPSFLVEAGHATNEDLTELLRRTMDKMYEIACDYPGLENHFAVILLEYCRRLGNAQPLKNFDFSEAFYQNEESDFILEFYQDAHRAIVKNLEEEYKDLKDKVTEADLKEFAKKIKLE